MILMASPRYLILSFSSVLVSCLLLLTGCGKPTLATIEIEPASASPLIVGQSRQFKAIARDTKGKTMQEVAIAWSVDGASGRVDAQGLLTALQPGTVTVTATAEEVRGTVTVTVQRQQAARLIVADTPKEVQVGQQVRVTVTAQNAAGEALPGVAVQAQSLSEATTVAPQRGTTDTAGQVTFAIMASTRAGQNQVRFSGDGQQATVTVQGNPGPPTRLQVEVGATQATAGEAVQVQVTVQDQAGNPVSGTVVHFTALSADTTLTPAEMATDLQGQASSTVQTNPRVGSNRFRIAVANLQAKDLEILGVTGAPARLTLHLDHAETIAGGTMSLKARVLDAHENPVAAVPLQVTVSPDSAALDATSLSTDAQGIAQTTVRTALEPGENTVQVTGAGLTDHITIIGQPPVALRVIPQNATVDMRGTYQFRAVAVDAQGHEVEVKPTWTFVGDTGTVDDEGLFTATKLDHDVILATYAGLSAGAQVTVVPGAVATVQITPAETTVQAGMTQQFQVAAFNAHGYPLEVTPIWEVTNEIGSMDASGLFAATTAGPGNIVVSVAETTGRAQVTVIPGELADVSISPERIVLQAGQEVQLQATGRDAMGNVVPIEPTWHLSANLGDLDATGVFRARHSGSGAISVAAGEPPVTVAVPVEVTLAPLERIEVKPQTHTLSAGETVQFSATGFDAYGNRLDITPQWRVSAKVGRLDAEGRLEARHTGSATVQAVVDEIVGEASVVVKPAALASLTIEPAGPLSLAAGETVSFSLGGQDAFGNTRVLRPTWRQTEPLGSLTQDGQFRAEKAGQTEVSVQSDDLQAVVQVTITPGKLAHITVFPPEVALPAGDTLTFHAVGRDAYQNPVEIQPSWRADTSIGEITAAAHFTALQAQTGQVIATAEGISGSAKVTVVSGALTLLEVTPDALELTAGESAQIIVVGYDAYGNPLQAQPVWYVTEGMGTVTPAGLFTAQIAGKGRVIAVVQHLAVVVDLIVVPGEVASLQIDPPSLQLTSGQQQRFMVQGFDRGGNTVPIKAEWAVRGDIGSIDADGVFTATVSGAGTVLAKVEALQGNAEVAVEPGAVTELRVGPESVSLVAGQTLALSSQAFDAAGNRVDTPSVWTVEDDMGTVSREGVLQARKAGTGAIVASIGEVQQRIPLQIQANALAAIALQPADVVMRAGETVTFSAAGYDAYGNPVPIEPIWSLQGMIGAIDAKQGMFQATTVGSGTVVAVVGPIAGITAVQVETGAAARLQLDPRTVTLTAGDQLPLSLAVFDAYNNVTTAETSWSMTAALGPLTAGQFSAQRAGETEIVVQSGDLETRTVVRVQPGPVVRLQLTPRQLEIEAGASQSLRVVGLDAFDNVREVDAEWSLSGELGTIDASGRLMATRQGKGSITARLGELSSQVDVTVVPGNVHRLVVTPGQAQVDATTVQAFSVIGFDAGGNRRPVTVNWALTQGIGSLDAAGRLAAVRVGAGTVVAYSGNIINTAEVTVVPGSARLLFVTPQRSTIPAGETVGFQVQGFDANRNALQVLQPHWSVLGNIGSIDPDTGVFAATQIGWGKIQATVGEASAYADVRVAHGLPDAERSRMVASRVHLEADGRTTTDIIVMVRDRFGNPVPEAQVTLISNRQDMIDQPSLSNRKGVAVGRIRSTKPGESEINAVVASERVSNTLRLTFAASGASG
ncbi:hypothetical protein NKDENANG_01605 [Candidatus Entotheonellaceae bacterium PAL068K]